MTNVRSLSRISRYEVMLSDVHADAATVAVAMRQRTVWPEALWPQFMYMFWYGFRSCTCPVSVNQLQRVVPERPRRVVITMTPLEASVPYSVAADGPFTISTFSISSGESELSIETDEFAIVVLFAL